MFTQQEILEIKNTVDECINVGTTPELTAKLARLFGKYYESNQDFKKYQSKVVAEVKTQLGDEYSRQFFILLQYHKVILQCRMEDARSVEILDKWMKANSFNQIESNEHTRSHKLSEVVINQKESRVIHKGLYPLAPDFSKDSDADRYSSLDLLERMIKHSNTIVVKHDWYNALGDMLQYLTSDIRLPYPITVFEFRMHGKSVTTLASQEQEEGVCHEIEFTHFVEFEKDKWFRLNNKDEMMQNAIVLAERQALAICIALDSKIAESVKITAGSQINKKRIKAGKTPLKNYHVVDLSPEFRQKKSASEAIISGERKSPRLHWRRGHWRHYDNGDKKWINWMLVGNVDLGYIDKHYRI